MLGGYEIELSFSTINILTCIFSPVLSLSRWWLRQRSFFLSEQSKEECEKENTKEEQEPAIYDSDLEIEEGKTIQASKEVD